MALQYQFGEREQTSARAHASNISSQGLQRKAVSSFPEALPVQKQSLTDEELPAQRVGIEEEELPVQPKSAIQRKANNTGLPDHLKSGVESLSGLDMSDVKVHYNSAQPAQLNAHAYAQGTDIHVAPGQEKHLPHEAWHVVQQKQGRVQATTQLKDSMPVNDDAGLEAEADLMGQKSLTNLGQGFSS
ncbi:eCIS core domain-containing protein [Chitinophaga rhizophila]|uniref:DUF4157 domain-containing protein n=1 Tax=Chitinophaga rhizophila TaxID=2866212 RepID=A0ABS7GGI4_9BACT|nr:DUF4157 domain-containing protein [Chitinophaga rhizophila]MBW8686802.1 DUF4157 domain-containing protein [Chitinophaga rhizophila]